VTDHPKIPQWLKDLGPWNLPEMDSRDAAALLLPDLDDKAQLIAIHSLLSRNRLANKELDDEIKRIEEFARQTSGFRNQRAVDEWVERMHDSVYQDAAHSMAAVGMLAPLIESIFTQAFRGIREQFFATENPPSAHPRWQESTEDQWDCHFVWKRGKRCEDLVAGIVQLAKATGLSSHLPNDLRPTLQALFGYRNKMFHNGFEWPVQERTRFKQRITDQGWPSDWFAKSETDKAPWIFYLTDAFIDHCLKTIDQIMDGLGAYVNETWNRRSQTNDPERQKTSGQEVG
jgi:hypothetical protein